MAKKIRFPLMMKDGTAVRTLEELREHFDLESVLGYFADGKLKTWLADRYYDEMAQRVAALSADMPDLNAQLCGIIGVDYSEQEDDTDFEALQRRNEKLRILREITTDSEILKKVDAVAFDQDELFDILDEAPKKIYLYGEKFSIPYAKRGITYIGVNTPIVFLEKSKYEYKNNGIDLINVKIDDSNAPYIYAEKLYIKGDYENALPLIRKEAENGNPRAMGVLAVMYFNGLGCECSEEKGKKWLEKAKGLNEPLSTIYYTYYCLIERHSDLSFRSLSSIQLQSFLESVEKIWKLADFGDPIAQFEYAYYQKWGCIRLSPPCKGVNMDYDFTDDNSMSVGYTNDDNSNKQVIQFLLESANRGFSPSIRLLTDNCFSIVPTHSMFFHNYSINQRELEKLEELNRYYQEGKIEDIKKRMLFY